ncbi:MAG: hypothetical protein K5662_00480 [Lachnospiraceae bacterium]|nr:hypothetical protein [Lachnospiraceae bacterium]
MNEFDFRILGLYSKMNRNKKTSQRLKVLAGACLFFSSCYCLGAKRIENIDKSEVLAANIVWIVSIIIFIGLYTKDSNCVKNAKSTEFEIYRLEVEDLRNKKHIAEITGEPLPDYALNKQIDMPNEKVSLPIIYYSVLLVIDIIIKIIIKIF